MQVVGSSHGLPQNCQEMTSFLTAGERLMAFLPQGKTYGSVLPKREMNVSKEITCWVRTSENINGGNQHHCHVVKDTHNSLCTTASFQWWTTTFTVACALKSGQQRWLCYCCNYQQQIFVNLWLGSCSITQCHSTAVSGWGSRCNRGSQQSQEGSGF